MSRGIVFGGWLLTGALLLANACSNSSPKPDAVEPPPTPAAAPTPPPVAPTPAPVPPTSAATLASARLAPDAGAAAAAPSPTVKLVVRTFPGEPTDIPE